MKIGRFTRKVLTILALSNGLSLQTMAETTASIALDAPRPSEAVAKPRNGLFILDYQNIQLPGSEEIDLVGYHILSPINDWAYFGLGGYAPFLKGDFGGFMAFGVLAHAQTKLTDNIFANAGLSFGGGGGGKSITESVELSGTGGFVRGYLGLGYVFGTFSVGANISHMEFFNSAINNTQLNIFVQKPFTTRLATYGRSGETFTLLPQMSQTGFGSMVSFALDNYVQINPSGSYKGVINAVDIQYANFMSKNTYWYYALSVGYKGLPIYNQVIAGVGARFALTDRMRLFGQVGLGSGGYAPTLIDTGSGLLFYPKLSAEFLIRKNTGLSLNTGYALALDGPARNFAIGVALSQYFGAANAPGSGPSPMLGRYDGYRFALSHETVFNMGIGDIAISNLNMITIQVDKLVSDLVYIPLRAAISYQSYRGFPGYGEVSMGIGVQNRYTTGDSVQVFGELQIGANVQGAIARSVIGLDYSLREGLALRAMVGKTFGNTGFRSTHFGLSLTSRFSLPNI